MKHGGALRIDKAGADEAPLLGQLNFELFEDEAHLYPMTLQALTERMQRWIAGEYQVLLFRRGDRVAGYAAWRTEDRGSYIRHFYICRDQRREGLGRAAMALMCREVLPKDQPVQIDATVWNQRALDFWRSLGFQDYAVSMELKAGEVPK